jgi:protease-4
MHRLIHETFNSQIHARGHALAAHLRELDFVFSQNTQDIKKIELPKLLYNSQFNLLDANSQPQGDVIAIIPYEGLMTKYSWWRFAAADIAAALMEYYNDPAIAGIILRANTYGGTLEAIIEVENALTKRNKPVMGFIDSNCYSAGVYNCIAHTDGVYASNPKAGLGSIGVMTQVMDDSKYYEKWGMTIKSIYPPESKFKNEHVREALAGNDKPMIEEFLSPLARGFQDAVKDARPKLDLSIKGIIEGKEFFASDAVNYNLIDGIMPIEDMIDMVFQKSKDYKSTQRQIKSILN